MYLTPEELEMVRQSGTYKEITNTAWSSWTFAGLLAYIDRFKKTPAEPVDFAVMKWLITLLDAKRVENSEQGQLNDEVHAAIIEAGGTPTESSYPLKTTRATGVVAGGGGAIAAFTLLAAVTDKKIFVEEITGSLSTDDAGAGLLMNFKDGAGGTVLFAVHVNNYAPKCTMRPLKAGTAATLLQCIGGNGHYAACTDDDTFSIEMKYREI